MTNVIIIGSGPAAHTAAIYTGRALLKPLLFEGEMAGGIAAGGQLTTTTEIENFPGFPIGISGFELMMRMREQSINCGALIETKTVTAVDLNDYPLRVMCADTIYEAKSVIIATGATAKRMNLVGEDRLWQKGISACAVCDGGLPFFRNKPLCVVGGGDSAAEEALYLTKFASEVTMVVRRDVLRASKIMQERLSKNKKIKILWNSIPIEAIGDTLLAQIRIKDLKRDNEFLVPAGGLFYAIGHQPNTVFLNGQILLDDAGYIKTEPGTTQTNIKGVFACGDVQDKRYRQAITAAGTGCMAALDAQKFLLN